MTLNKTTTPLFDQNTVTTHLDMTKLSNEAFDATVVAEQEWLELLRDRIPPLVDATTDFDADNSEKVLHLIAEDSMRLIKRHTVNGAKKFADSIQEAYIVGHVEGVREGEKNIIGLFRDLADQYKDKAHIEEVLHLVDELDKASQKNFDNAIGDRPLNIVQVPAKD